MDMYKSALGIQKRKVITEQTTKLCHSFTITLKILELAYYLSVKIRQTGMETLISPPVGDNFPVSLSLLKTIILSDS